MRLCGVLEEAPEIAARELPLEGLGDLLAVVLNAENAGSHGVLGREVARGERFALEHGEPEDAAGGAIGS